MEFETLSWDNYVFRQVTRDDCNIVHELLLELCDYENLHTEFKSTPEDLENILFNLKCGDAILVYDNESDEYIGVILLSYNYSTFKGKPGIFIEDCDASGSVSRQVEDPQGSSSEIDDIPFPHGHYLADTALRAVDRFLQRVHINLRKLRIASRAPLPMVDLPQSPPVTPSRYDTP